MNKFLVSVPFTGLGLYGGFRGNRWLRNRIKIFKQFVIPAILNQTDRDFIVWVSWRREEKTNPHVIELYEWMKKIPNLKTVFTYSGIPFWDDKYEDSVARDRLAATLQGALPDLMDVVGEAENVYWLLQPSDDCYHRETVASVKKAFEDPETEAVGYTEGFLMNYNTKELLTYNPNTNPPFFAIKFPRDIFFDPGKHMSYTGPYKSHEYVGDKLKMAHFRGRGFLVGTHGENISTHFNHPFGKPFEGSAEAVLADFGIVDVPKLSLSVSLRKMIMRRLPYRWQRKLRYLFGEKLYSRFYNWIRN